MSWTLLGGLFLLLTTAVALLARRRWEHAQLAQRLDERDQARERGSARARLQYPNVDLARCMGCGTCIRACPEEGVLDLIHGQAVVVHGARCVGHGRCAQECPTGAITVTLGDTSERRDIPALDEAFEVPRVPGLFLAGELTGYALVRTAIGHGQAVATEVARRVGAANGGRNGRANGHANGSGETLDLLVVGAGPAGLSCSLEAKKRGLSFAMIEREELGGTVAKYPRRKLVMTQPVELPLHGRLDRTSYLKEELMDLWEGVVREHELPLRTGVDFHGLERDADGALRVRTSGGEVRARNVCLALGRRGTPRKLGVPGEELPKVTYGLLDARSYVGRRVLVVGGGDSAIEAALGLAEQPGNQVTLSYRRHAFFRIKARNEARLAEAVQGSKLWVVYNSTVERIEPDRVHMVVNAEEGEERFELANDDVFVLAGGVPPFKMLEELGVSFDPADRPRPEPMAAGSNGLLPSLVAALGLSGLALGWVLVFRGYYGLPLSQRTGHELHDLLRPAGTVGLALGLCASALILVNLCYLLRRSQRLRFTFGSLQAWMTSHLVTGILALLFAVLHAAMGPRDTVGGHALLGLAVLVCTGAIGRYFYSFVPRAANGRELAIDEVRGRLSALSAEWDRGNRDFGERVRQEIHELVAEGRWTGSFLRRLWALWRAQARLRGRVAGLRARARAEGLPEDQIDALVDLARRAQRSALTAAHYEDLRGLLASWRYLHRWVALLMVLLVAAHVVTALRYAAILD